VASGVNKLRVDGTRRTEPSRASDRLIALNSLLGSRFNAWLLESPQAGEVSGRAAPGVATVVVITAIFASCTVYHTPRRTAGGGQLTGLCATRHATVS